MYCNIISCSNELISRSDDIISHSDDIISRSHDILSRFDELISRPDVMLCHSDDIFSRSDDLISHSDDIITHIISRSDKLTLFHISLAAAVHLQISWFRTAASRCCEQHRKTVVRKKGCKAAATKSRYVHFLCVF